MAEEIKYVEEAPESQPSVREKLAWVPGYPRDRLDEFLDNIALLVRQALVLPAKLIVRRLSNG
jgi:hypothetical protein